MMKKKVLIIILIGILTLGITGCELVSKEKNYSLGEQVKTELIKFKLLEGKYSYALSSTLNETYGAPKEYDEKSDKDSPFLASKGHTLVALSFSVENLDRTDLELENSFIEAKYNGKKYSDNKIEYKKNCQKQEVARQNLPDQKLQIQTVYCQHQLLKMIQTVNADQHQKDDRRCQERFEQLRGEIVRLEVSVDLLIRAAFALFIYCHFCHETDTVSV